MKIRLIFILCLGLLAILVVSGCNGGDEDKVTLEDVKKQASEAVDTAIKYTKQQHEEIMAKFDEQYKQMQGQVDEFMDQAKEKAREGHQQARQVIIELQQKQAVASEKLKALQDAGEDTYKQAKQELAEALADLSETLAKASEEIKKD